MHPVGLRRPVLTLGFSVLVSLLLLAQARLPPAEAKAPRTNRPAASLQIHYLDVGQGDAAVMTTPGGTTARSHV
jgi:beta-lactamase superfamily II metal-dependent hydrolase